jgi:glycosyltransferase involved in cell wall biosynthesis
MIKSAEKKVGNLIARRFVKKLHKRNIHRPVVNTFFAINLVTSWNKQCGIATYSAFLVEELKKNVKLSITNLPNKNALNPYFIILGYIVGHSCDLVHVQFEYGLFPNLKLGKKHLTAFSVLLFYFGLSIGNRRVITTFHEPRKTITARGKSGRLYSRLLDGLIFAVSDLIIVHTLESKALMKTLYGVAESKLRVIPHGSFEKPRFLDKNESKSKLGLEGKTVLTILGFVTPKKGHDLIIPLLPRLDETVQLVVAGGPQTAQDEVYLNELKELAERYQSLDKIAFTGYLPDLTEVLNATDLALLPYRTVTDSGILHLLVAYRLPTIASDLKAFREVYDEYGCLELFKSEDTADLLMKIQTLLSNPTLRESLKVKCEGMWNATKWSNIAKKHVEIYSEVLSAAPLGTGLP